MLESRFKRKTLKRISERLSGINLDFIHPNRRSQPDVIILGPKVWAALEFKKEKNSNKQPNQVFYVSRMNEQSYARFVHPGNVEGVLDELEQLFTP